MKWIHPSLNIWEDSYLWEFLSGMPKSADGGHTQIKVFFLYRVEVEVESTGSKLYFGADHSFSNLYLFMWHMWAAW